MYKALITFSGKVSMVVGELKEITDETIAKDLLRAGYIEEYPAKKGEEKKPATKKRTTK